MAPVHQMALAALIVNTVSLVYWQSVNTRNEKLREEEEEKRKREKQEEENREREKHEEEVEKRIRKSEEERRISNLTKQMHNDVVEYCEKLCVNEIDTLLELCALEERTYGKGQFNKIRYDGYTGDDLKKDILKKIGDHTTGIQSLHRYRVEISSEYGYYMTVGVLFGLTENGNLYFQKMFPERFYPV